MFETLNHLSINNNNILWCWIDYKLHVIIIIIIAIIKITLSLLVFSDFNKLILFFYNNIFLFNIGLFSEIVIVSFFQLARKTNCKFDWCSNN